MLEWIQTQITVLRRRDDITSENPSEAQDNLKEIKRFIKDDIPRKEVSIFLSFFYLYLKFSGLAYINKIKGGR